MQNWGEGHRGGRAHLMRSEADVPRHAVDAAVVEHRRRDRRRRRLRTRTGDGERAEGREQEDNGPDGMCYRTNEQRLVAFYSPEEETDLRHRTAHRRDFAKTQFSRNGATRYR